MEKETLVKVEGLKKFYPVSKGFLTKLLGTKEKEFIHAVDKVDFVIKRGEILGLAGESGCGKTTTGRLLSILEKPTSGNIIFKDINLTDPKFKLSKHLRSKIQMIYQDPYQSIDPRFTVYQTVSEPLDINKIASSKDEKTKLVIDALTHVELRAEDCLNKYPNELSGGERQRVAIARAIITYPELIIADEPVSMLDISIRAGILELLIRLKNEFNITYLFITHDLSIIRYISDKVGIMYLGEFVEIGITEKIISNPQHPYTQLLISSVQNPDPTIKRKRAKFIGELPSNINLPKGCRFNTRCTYAMDICKEEKPKLIEVDSEQKVACHLLKK